MKVQKFSYKNALHNYNNFINKFTYANVHPKIRPFIKISRKLKD